MLLAYDEYYITRKPTFGGMRALAFWNSRMLQIATRVIPGLAQKTLLEIGPGHGLLADACKRSHIDYYGLEMNETQAQALTLQGHNVAAATVPPIPKGGPTQVIWLSHMLEHANSYSEAKTIIQACYDRLDPAGFVVIIGPDILHWREEFWSIDWSHGFPTTINRVEQLLNETGFKIFRSMHHTFTVTNPLVAWFLSWMFRALLPINLLDFCCKKFTGRQYAHAFMSVFGWRQIFVVGSKG
jgi:hypothetical protein